MSKKNTREVVFLLIGSSLFAGGAIVFLFMGPAQELNEYFDNVFWSILYRFIPATMAPWLLYVAVTSFRVGSEARRAGFPKGVQGFPRGFRSSK